MNDIKKVNKQEAARRQLDAAIEWYFEGGDLLPIYNIASSVFVMTENLAKKDNIEHTFYGVMGSELNNDELKNLKIEMGRKHGFLKHGDRDTPEIIDVNEKQAAAILYYASENYTHLFKEQSSQMALIKAFVYSYFGREIGIEEEYMKQIERFELIAKQEGITRLKEIIGQQLKNYKKLNNGSDRSVHKIKAA